MAKTFNRIIKAKQVQQRWVGIQIKGTPFAITHSFFANDTLLFGKANVQEAKVIKRTLDLYLEVLGQRVNVQKSKVYIFFTNPTILRKLINMLSFCQEQLPSLYLGIPLFAGNNKAIL